MNGRREYHGASKHRLYYVWKAMWYRCTNPACPDFKNYGGRGISVCEEWADFWNFEMDMAASWKPGLTLERKDNNGNYSPENCKWADRFEQNSNSRKNRTLDFNGVVKTVSEWSRETQIPHKTIEYRMLQGWTADRILKSGTENLSRNALGQYESV